MAGSAQNAEEWSTATAGVGKEALVWLLRRILDETLGIKVSKVSGVIGMEWSHCQELAGVVGVALLSP